jgi:excisionase family DNA binding protein
MIGTGEAARILRVSVETVRAWADEGKLAAERSACGRRLLKVAEVEKLAQHQARQFGK